jgi:hypothetical protein
MQLAPRHQVLKRQEAGQRNHAAGRFVGHPTLLQIADLAIVGVVMTCRMPRS